MQGTLSVTALLGYPLALVFAAILIRKATTVTPALRYSWFFPLIAAVTAVLLVFVRNFELWVALVVVYSGMAYFPYLFYKTLPQVPLAPNDCRWLPMAATSL